MPPPSKVSPQSLGFTDIVEDSDGVLRRHLLAMAPAEPCNTDKSFSFQLAQRYLSQEKSQIHLNSDINSQSKSKLILPYLENNSGSYANIDSFGYQLMLNWRSTPQIADRVTLFEVLNNRINPDLVKDKIVIIGTTAESFNNYCLTPLSAKSFKKTPGVIIHAHMTSQIISASLDNRPLLWVWSKWIEALWIYMWTLVAAIIAWKSKSLLQLALNLALAQTILYFLCYILLIQGGWIPFIPAILALLIGSGTVSTYKLKSVATNSQPTSDFPVFS
ncbi:MAG: CHASE2 domain-containing protein [Cyanobacteria bacterium P01_C01_bin.38]